MPKYNESEEAGMAQGSPMPEEQPAPGDKPAEREDTFFIPSDHLSKHLDPTTVKAGDILEFKVVGHDANGDIEAEYNTGDDAGGDHPKDWKTDLTQSMGESPGAAPEPAASAGAY